MGLKEQLQAAAALRHEALAVPGLDEPVQIWTVAGNEWQALLDASFDTDALGRQKFNRSRYNAQIVAACVRDAEGNRLFGMQEVDAINAMSAGVLNRLVHKAELLNGVFAGAEEQKAKNS